MVEDNLNLLSLGLIISIRSKNEGSSLNLTKKTKKKEESSSAPVSAVVVTEGVDLDQKDAEDLLSSILAIQQAEEESDKRGKMISLFGEIEEEKCGEIAYALRYLANKFESSNKNEGDSKGSVELIISTHGGSAADMFAVYDIIRLIRDQCDVITTGVGKVMSGGVLLLASGAKGQRRVGANCRIMLHGVASGHAGQIHSLENELEEVRWTQNQYIRALAIETDMTQKYIKKLIERRVNVYLTAKEAVELGIADEIF